MSVSTRKIVEAFNEAFGRHDVDAVMALMTDDCVFENTLPVPDGERHVGQRDGHIRGIDLFKVRDGKVAEKLSYVKG